MSVPFIFYFDYFLLLSFYYPARGGVLTMDQPLARPLLRSETLVVLQHFILLICVLLLGVGNRVILSEILPVFFNFIEYQFAGLLRDWCAPLHTHFLFCFWNT